MQGAEHQEDRGEWEDGPSGVSFSRSCLRLLPFSYTLALLKQVIKCPICVHTHTQTCKHVQYICMYIYLFVYMYIYIYIIHTHTQKYTKDKSELSWCFWTIQRSFVPCGMSQRRPIPPWHVWRHPQPGVCSALWGHLGATESLCPSEHVGGRTKQEFC